MAMLPVPPRRDLTMASMPVHLVLVMPDVMMVITACGLRRQRRRHQARKAHKTKHRYCEKRSHHSPSPSCGRLRNRDRCRLFDQRGY
jgi:hypothetical protein